MNRNHDHEMNVILARVLGGLAVKAMIAAVVIYVGVEAYDYVAHVFDPVRDAMAGAR